MRTRTRLTVLTVLATFASLFPSTAALSLDPATAEVFVSEFHYDNDGTDTGEAIEIQGPAGTDLTGWSVVLYNGNDNTSYDTAALSGTIPDLGGGSGVLVVDYPSNGIQNGSPDGIALIDSLGTVVQFVSYEGTMTAADGPASGTLSTDVGVAEGSSTAAGLSLQRSPAGAWMGPVCASFGEINDPAAPGTCPIEGVSISEIHYDNDGTDVNEAVEIHGPAGADLTGWSVVLYNGSNGAPYDTDTISGSIPDLGGGFGVLVISYPSNGIQNGAPDGVALVDAGGALVEFLSYEGTFTGVGGPADGIMSTDLGVEEGSATLEDQSLQKIDDTWNSPACASFGQINDPSAPTECPVVEVPDVRFSEIHYDNDGTDANEAIEVYGPAGTDLTGWTVVLYNGNNGAPYDTDTISGSIPDLDGGAGVVVVDYPANGIQNGEPDGFALVDGGGDVVEFLSYEGTITATGGPAAGLTSVDLGVAETGTTGSDQSLQRDLEGAWDGPFCASFGEVNDPAAPADCPADPIEAFIHDVQGPGETTPLVGQPVIVEGIVTGDLQGSDLLDGFSLQEEDADADTDTTTSEGIFVYAPGGIDVSTGDLVRVEGDPVEYQGETQIDASSVEIVTPGTGSVDDSVVSTITLSFPVDVSFDYEHIEGMLVTVPQDMYINEYFNYDRFGEMVIGADRYQQPTAEFEPGSPEQLAALDLITRGQITLDDTRSSQNPEVLRHPNGDPLALNNLFRGGDVLNDVTGFIGAAFGYRIQPTEAADYTATNQRPDQHEPVGGRLEVASFNVLNYFTTIDDGVPICGPAQNVDCRGANDAEEFQRQSSKIVSALLDIDADVFGVIEIENHHDDVAMADLVERLNAVAGPGVYDFVRHDEGGVKAVGTDAIRVGIIYKTSVVSPVGSDAVLDDPSFLDPLSTGEDKNRAAQAQMFEEVATGETFSVVVNHLKSKGSGCGPGDDDTTTGQGNCNGTRAAAAAALADWIDTDPYFAADSDVLLIGDLNSYDKEEPIDVLAAAGYTDLVAAYQGPEAYSYLFSGQLGYLDYAMSSPSLTAQVTGTTVWHINSDEPDVLDYNTDFKGPAQTALWEPNAFRSSDHDPVVVGLALDQTAPVVEAGFDTILTTRVLGLFQVEATCVDNVDPDPDCVADINGVPVEDGQVVLLIKARGRSWHKTILGVLNMKDSDFILTVTGTDDAGNSATSTAEPVFRLSWPW